MLTHIVYYATYKDEIVYIGSGLLDRYKHVKSGVSHVYGLNKLYFTDPENLKVYIYRGYTSDELSLNEESVLIQTFKPCFNIRNCDRSYDHYRYTIKDIQKYMQEKDDCYNDILKHLNKINKNKDLYKQTIESIKSGNELFFTIEDGFITINKHWKDYIEYKNLSDKDLTLKSNFFENPFNFNVEVLKKNANRSVNSLMLEYNELQQLNDESKLQHFLQDNSEFNEWIAAGVTTAMMGTLQYNRSKISEKAYELRTIGDNENIILKELNLEIGLVYSRDDLIEKVTNVYQKLNISTEKVKATEIKKWYKIKNSSKIVDGKLVAGYKIVSKL